MLLAVSYSARSAYRKDFVIGALLVTAVNGLVSIDPKRRRARDGLLDEFAAQTSRLPFAAILAGRTRFEISEFRAWQIALAAVLFAGVFWLHGIVGPCRSGRCTNPA